MARKKNIPVAGIPERLEGAGILRTYEELALKAKLFAESRFGLLVITGLPGVAKSTIIKNAIKAVHGDDFCFIEANASPFGAYRKLWQYRNKPVLFDDADPIHEQPDGRRLLKQIGQTEQWCRMSWESKVTMGKRALAPSEFWTSSKVCIITNKWEFRGGNIHTAAVEDRGQCYAFLPTTLEVHKYTATWFWDQEVYDYTAQHLPFLRQLSCRLYYKAWEQKEAGDDWRRYILGHVFGEADPEYHIVRLLNDTSFPSNNMRAKKFAEDTQWSRATFYRHLADLEERRGLQEVPYIRVLGKRPEDQPDPMAGMEDAMPDDEEDADGEE